MALIAPSAPARVVTSEAASRRTTLALSTAPWSLLAWIGAAFVTLGFADIALGWYPAAFGNAEWEFGTISGSLNALPIPMLGTFLLAAAALAHGSTRWSRAMAVSMGLLAIAVAGLGIVYLTVVPVALKMTADNPIVQLGMKKAIAKALLLGIVNFGLLVLGAVRVWKGARPGTAARGA